MTLTDHQARAVAGAFAVLNNVGAKITANSIEFGGGKFITFVPDGSLYVADHDKITEDYDTFSDFLAAYGM